MQIGQRRRFALATSIAAFAVLAACSDSAPGVAGDGGSADGRGVADGRSSDGPRGDGPPLSPDAGPTCNTPTPFVPPGKPAGWRHTSTGLFVVTQGAANHRGQDVVVAKGKPQLLVGKFAYGPLDKDLKGEDVELFIQEAPPCGPWVSHGVSITSQDGEHGNTYGVDDDGGRVFHTIEAARALPVGRYPLRLLVKGDHSLAAFTLYVLAPGTQAVVFDIDGTLTTDDFELIAQIFDQLASGKYVPKAYPGGENVAQAWAQRGYLPVYLTGRPDILRLITQPWLVGRNVPPGPLHLTDTTGQALPTAVGVGKYKTDFLNRLKSEGGVEIVAGYGNASTDIQAYAGASVDKKATFIIGKNAGHDGTQALADYPSHLPWVQARPAAKTAAPPATFGW